MIDGGYLHVQQDVLVEIEAPGLAVVVFLATSIQILFISLIDCEHSKDKIHKIILFGDVNIIVYESYTEVIQDGSSKSQSFSLCFLFFSPITPGIWYTC